MKSCTPEELLLLLKFSSVENVLWHLIEIDHMGIASKFTPEEKVTAELLETNEFRKERKECKN